MPGGSRPPWPSSSSGGGGSHGSKITGFFLCLSMGWMLFLFHYFTEGDQRWNGSNYQQVSLTKPGSAAADAHGSCLVRVCPPAKCCQGDRPRFVEAGPGRSLSGRAGCAAGAREAAPRR